MRPILLTILQLVPAWLLFQQGDVGWVQGRVVDAEGRPVPGINVFRGPADKIQIRRAVAATTDEQGQFKFAVEPGRHLLNTYDEMRGYPNTYRAVFSYGRYNTWVIVNVQNGETIDGVLLATAPKEGRLRILVVDDQTQNPIVGAGLNIMIFESPEIFSGHSVGHVDGIPVEVSIPAEVDLKMTVEAHGYETKTLLQGDSERIRYQQGERRELVVPLRRMP